MGAIPATRLFVTKYKESPPRVFKLFDIANLNVCGLRRRSNFPEFLEIVQRFDLLCFSETKIDGTDVT